MPATTPGAAHLAVSVFLATALACGGGDRRTFDGGPARDGSPTNDSATGGDGGTPGTCVPAPGWTVEQSPIRGKQGIAADAAGTLHLVGIGPTGLEVHRRAIDGTWSPPESSGLMPSWTLISASLPVAVGPGGEIVVEHEGNTDVVHRDAAGTWSLDDLGAILGPTADPLIDADGTAHLVRRGVTGMIQHQSRAPGGSWVAQTLTGLPDTPPASVGRIDGALTICAVMFPDLVCTTRDATGTWPAGAVVPTGLEVRTVVSAGSRWVIGNQMRVDSTFISTRTVLEPSATGPWRTIATDVSPQPDASAVFFVGHEPSADTHMVQQLIDPADTSTAQVRYIRVAAEGSVQGEYVACDAFRPDIAVLTGDRPVVLYEANDETSGTLETYLAFGP